MPKFPQIHAVPEQAALYGSSRLGSRKERVCMNCTTATLPAELQGVSYVIRGEKSYELSNHLGNVLAVVSDRREAGACTDSLVDFYYADGRSVSDYYPFGMAMDSRTQRAGGYMWGFGGHEKVDEVYGSGNTVDMGDRWLDVRLGRTPKMDSKADDYPNISPYAYSLNTPIWAYDPDGRLVIFVNGLRPFQGAADQNWLMGGLGIYAEPNAGVLRDYWRTERNAFGREADMAEMFMARLNDNNAYFTSGSSTYNSKANPDYFDPQSYGDRSRFGEGYYKANKFHRMVKDGDITLAEGETIKIITHSQGAAHGQGMATRLIELGYKVEVIYNITPHQPTDIRNPEGVRGVQYSHPNDAVSSKYNWLQLFNGGSKFGRIQNITEFDGRDIMGGEDQPACGGPMGNRCGHNVTDNDFIFNIPEGEPGHVSPRQDNPNP